MSDFWAAATGAKAIEYIEEVDLEVAEEHTCAYCGWTSTDGDEFISDEADIELCLDCTYRIEK